MKTQVEAAAFSNHRSINAEIIARLSDSFDTQSLLPRLGTAIDEMEKELIESRNQVAAVRELVNELGVSRLLIKAMIASKKADMPEMLKTLRDVARSDEDINREFMTYMDSMYKQAADNLSESSKEEAGMQKRADDINKALAEKKPKRK